MELKFKKADDEIKKLEVLIVPLWNWNDYAKVLASDKACSNRTFMELKYSKPEGDVTIALYRYHT